jgi:hypothetical protein
MENVKFCKVTSMENGKFKPMIEEEANLDLLNLLRGYTQLRVGKPLQVIL